MRLYSPISITVYFNTTSQLIVYTIRNGTNFHNVLIMQAMPSEVALHSAK